MKITRTSILSGVTRTLDLDVTQAELDRYHNGALLQDAFPELTPAEREFIHTGIVDSEWQNLFRRTR